MSPQEQITARLVKIGAAFEIIAHDKPIRTVDDAKGIFEISQTAPVLILTTDKGHYALIKSAVRRRVDLDAIKETLGCERVKLAGKQEVVDITGHESGQVPLIGHGLPCVFDNLLLDHPFVYGGTGSLTHTLKINPRDLERANTIAARID